MTLHGVKGRLARDDLGRKHSCCCIVVYKIKSVSSSSDNSWATMTAGHSMHSIMFDVSHATISNPVPAASHPHQIPHHSPDRSASVAPSAESPVPLHISCDPSNPIWLVKPTHLRNLA